MERGTDRATVVVVAIALPFLLVSAAILAGSLLRVGRAVRVEPATGERSLARRDTATESGAKTNDDVSKPALVEPPREQAAKTDDAKADEAKTGEGKTDEAKADKAKADAPAGPSQAAGKQAAVRPAALGELYDRGAYEALQELKALVDSEAWAEAARLVMTFDPQKAAGPAPWIGDQALVVSLRVAARLAHDEYPQMRRALGEQFETLARLRVAEAIRAADATAIEMATRQFPGARATAEAHLWLADEAMASGRFRLALAHYRAAASADPEAREQAGPRIRLAGAMIGQNAGEPAAGEVVLGDRTLSAADFEALAEDMRERALKEKVASGAAGVWTPAAGVSRLNPRARGLIEGVLPTAGREAAPMRRAQAAADGNVAYVATAGYVVAYDLGQHRILWRGQAGETRHARGGEGRFEAGRPLVWGGRVYARLVHEHEPRLCAFEATSGELVWAAEAGESQALVSPPVLVDGRLLVLVSAKVAGGRRMLEVRRLDASSGDVISRRTLVALEDEWDARSGRLVSCGTGAVAIVGPLVMGIDESLAIAWVREQAGAAREPECAGEIVVVAHDEAVAGLESETGRVRWKQEQLGGRTCALADETTALISARNAADQDAETELIWLRPEQGEILARCKVTDLAPRDRLEALISGGNRLFAVVSREREADLRILELEAARDAAESRF